MAANQPVDLSILIVTWNVWDLLRACLQSIEALSWAAGALDRQRRFGPADAPLSLEVIVVDNAAEGAADATADLLPARFPWVRYIRSERNLGFTAGNNRAYAASRGRFVLFLNPDTEITRPCAGEDSLWRLYRAVAGDATVALAGPQLRYADNSVQSSRRRFPTRLTGFFESTWLGRLWPGNPWARRLHMDDWPADFAHDVDWVVGAAMLARRAALEQVRMTAYAGPFDEGFFMYSEELDLCRRLKGAGRRIIYAPQAVIVHYEGRSSEQAVAARHIRFNTSKVRYVRKVFGPAWAEALRRYLLLEYRVQLWLEQAKRLAGHKPELRAQRIDVYRRTLADGLRPPR